MGRPIIDLRGQRFGRLVATEFLGLDKESHSSWWRCRCDCGVILDVRTSALRKKNPQQACSEWCGRELHGHAGKGNKSPEYVAWCNIRRRCSDPKASGYHRYGGRGIKVCLRWDHSFPLFLKDMGHKPGPEYSIERRKTDGHYQPGNCFWATKKEQMRNMSTNHMVEVSGRKMCLAEACEVLGLNYHNVRARIYRGKTFEEAAY